MNTERRRSRVEHTIEILADGDFHSGEELGLMLGGVSRTSVHQYVESIIEMGIDVFGVKGKGYRLKRPIQLLDLDRIEIGLHRKQLEVEVDLHRIVPSSNDVLKDLIKQQPVENGYTVIAEAQTAGRGRRGKAWISPFGTNIYISMYWRLEQGMAAAMGLSVALGARIAELLDSKSIPNVEVKWPNDIYIGGKKVAGILVELEGQATGECHAILGIGLNISMKDDTKIIDQPWTCLENELLHQPDRNNWAVSLIACVYNCLRDFETSGLDNVQKLWQRVDRVYDQTVALSVGNKQINGVAKGIDQFGALLLQTDTGMQTFQAGEVSLKPAPADNP